MSNDSLPRRMIWIDIDDFMHLGTLVLSHQPLVEATKWIYQLRSAVRRHQAKS